MSEVFRQYNSLSPESKRSIQTWRPVVTEVLHSLSELDDEQVLDVSLIPDITYTILKDDCSSQG